MTGVYIIYCVANVVLLQMLKKTLSLKDCQLVRLGLMGNALGDAGVKLLSPSLQVSAKTAAVVLCELFAAQASKSLTCLDLRSNGITSLGLRSLEAALTRNAVLYRVDFRNNPAISLQASTSVQQLLKSFGSEVKCIFSSVAASDAESSSASVSPSVVSSEVSVLYRSPLKVGL